MASEILVPARVLNEQREQFVVEGTVALARYWTKVLKDHDPQLSIVWVGRGATSQPDMRPERWHVRRRNDFPLADSYMPITTPDGGYREPDSGVMEEVQRRDMQNRTVDQILAEREAKEQARVRARELTREQLKDEMAADIRAAQRLGR